jgi:hypothetical protein
MLGHWFYVCLITNHTETGLMYIIQRAVHSTPTVTESTALSHTPQLCPDVLLVVSHLYAHTRQGCIATGDSAVLAVHWPASPVLAGMLPVQRALGCGVVLTCRCLQLLLEPAAQRRVMHVSGGPGAILACSVEVLQLLLQICNAKEHVCGALQVCTSFMQ